MLADVVRKLAAGFRAPVIKSSYGLSDATDAARARFDAMKAEEEPWYVAAMQP